MHGEAVQLAIATSSGLLVQQASTGRFDCRVDPIRLKRRCRAGGLVEAVIDSDGAARAATVWPAIGSQVVVSPIMRPSP